MGDNGRTVFGKHARDRRRGRLFERPTLWALGYLACIPIFAWLYVGVFSGEFSQSNQAFESQRFTSDRQVLGDRITPAFESALATGVQAEVELVGIAGAMRFPVLRVSTPEGRSIDIWFDNGDSNGDVWCAVGTPTDSFSQIVRTPGQFPGFEAPIAEYSDRAGESAQELFREIGVDRDDCDGYWRHRRAERTSL